MGLHQVSSFRESNQGNQGDVPQSTTLYFKQFITLKELFGGRSDFKLIKDGTSGNVPRFTFFQILSTEEISFIAESFFIIASRCFMSRTIRMNLI